MPLRGQGAKRGAVGAGSKPGGDGSERRGDAARLGMGGAGCCTLCLARRAGRAGESAAGARGFTW
eukprot:13994709-Heterocapsa_arctica.AAC.1